MGSVVLAVTGAEALYADMGHFGRRPIRLSWLVYVMPALMLNYMGQGAMILSLNAEGAAQAVRNPFFLLAPEVARLPLIIVATSPPSSPARRSSPAPSPSPSRRSISAWSRDSGSATPARRRRGRSTFRSLTGR
jgi:hypothetical protein